MIEMMTVGSRICSMCGGLYMLFGNFGKTRKFQFGRSIWSSPLSAGWSDFENSHDSKLTVSEMSSKLTEYFKLEDISEPASSAGYIIAHAIGKKTLHSVPGSRILTSDQLQKIDCYSKKRANGLPIQYVLGDWDFRDLTLTMQPPVLIPRPETEELVELMLLDPRVRQSKILMEVGCGSGALSLALLKELPELMVIAIDSNADACSLARSNAENLQLGRRINIINVELSNTTINAIGHLLPEQIDLLVSNPPYIPTAEIEYLQSEVKKFEDVKALDGGQDGLDIVRIILEAAPHFVKPGGSVWLEVDHRHPDIIQRMVSQSPVEYIKTYEDFCQKPRFCQLTVKSS